MTDDELKDLFARARRPTSSWSQARVLESAAGGSDARAADLAWRGIRLGYRLPGGDGIFRLLYRSESYTAADLAAFLASVGDDQGDLAEQWARTPSNLLGPFGYVAARVRHDPAPVAAVWRSLRPPLRALVGYTLARLGMIPGADVDDATVEHVARFALCGIYPGSDNRYYLEDCLGGAAEAFGERWPAALLRVALSLGAEGIQYVPAVTPYLARASVDERVTIALAAAERALDHALAILRDLGDDAVPPLLRAADAVLPPAPACWKSHMLAAMCVVLTERLEARGEVLDARYDLLFHAALGVEHGALAEALARIPEARREAILTRPGGYHAWTYFRLCPTPAVRRHAVDLVAKMGHNPQWSDHTRAAAGLRELGPAVAPVILDALANHAKTALWRHVLVEALGDAGDPAAAPALVALFRDNAPRHQDYSTSHGFRGQAPRDVPRLAAQALVRLAGKVPEGVVLAALAPPLAARKADLRAVAVDTLAHLERTPAVVALAASLLPGEKSEDLEKTLAAIAAAPAAAPADPLAAALPEPDRAALRASLAASGLASWEAHRDRGPALVAVATDVVVDRALRGESLWDLQAPWQALLRAFADDPAVAAHLARAYRQLPAGASGASTYLYFVGDPVPAVTRILADEILRGAPPPAAAEVYAHCWRTDLMVHGLLQPDKAIRKKCAENLKFGGDAAADALLPLLGHGTSDVRAVAAATLGSTASARHLPALRAALAKEKHARTANLLGATVAALAARAAGPVALPDAPDAASDAALDARLADTPASVVPEAFRKVALPALKWRTGAALSEGATRWVLVRLAKLDAELADAELPRVRSRLDDASAHAFYSALATLSHDAGVRRLGAGLLGTEQDLEAFAPKLDEEVMRYNRGRDMNLGVAALRLHRSPTALRWLAHWSRAAESPSLRARAEAGMREVAQARGASLEDVFDDLVPAHGFDAAGAQPFAYGARSYALALTPEATVAVVGEGGKVIAKLPDPGAKEDATKLKAARDALGALRKAVKATVKAQTARREEAMVAGRAWDAARFARAVLAQPVVARLAGGVAWRVRAGGATTLVRPSPDGTLRALDGAAFALPPDAVVDLPHPAALDEATRTALAEAHKRTPWKETVAQVDRAVLAPPAGTDADAWVLSRVDAIPALAPLALVRGLAKRGYEAGAVESGGQVHAHRRRVGADAAIVVQHEGTYVAGAETGDPVVIQGVAAVVRGETVPWSRAPAGMLSEALADLGAIHAA